MFKPRIATSIAIAAVALTAVAASPVVSPASAAYNASGCTKTTEGKVSTYYVCNVLGSTYTCRVHVSAPIECYRW